MSHRRKRNLQQKAKEQPKPRDLIDVIAWNSRAQRVATGLGSTLRLNTRWVLALGALGCLFQAAGSWTTDLVSKLPLVGFGALFSAILILHMRWLQ